MATMTEAVHGETCNTAIAALAANADAMSLRLAALERAVKVAPVTDAPAPGPRTWPVGSLPPVAVRQVRSYRATRYVIVMQIGSDFTIRWANGAHDTFPPKNLVADPLAEPWTEPAITPADPRIAALEAERDALASQLATMAAEAIALRGERDAAVAKERADVVAWLRSRDFDHVDVSNYTKHRAIEEVMCDVTTQIERGAHAGASEK